MKIIKKYIDKSLLILAGTLLFFMFILTLWQVISRYILNTPSTFSEEIIRMMLIWFSLAGASYVFGQKKHIALLFVRDQLPKNIQIVLEKATDILLLIVSIVLMIWGGFNVVDLTLTQTAPSTGISMAVMYGALPIAGILISFYAIYGLLYSKLPEKEQEEGVV